MASASISDVAYSKVLLHCAKYPWANVFGILLSSDVGTANEIVDVIPCFHTAITAPSLETAMLLIGQICTQEKKKILGVYFCGEDEAVPKKITQQLALKCKSPVFLLSVLKPKLFTEDSPFQLVAPSGADWKLVKVQVQTESAKSFNRRLEADVATKVVDFDDCLEDVSKDFRNIGLLN